MEKLKPCPFCGGKAYVQIHIFDGVPETYGVLCANGKCYTSGWQFYDTAEEAIEAWNRRAERKIGKWIPEKSYSPRNETGILYVCSECGAGYEYKTNFCPSCGKKMEGSEE